MLSEKASNVIDLIIPEMDEAISRDPAHLAEIAPADRFSGSHEVPELLFVIRGDQCQ